MKYVIFELVKKGKGDKWHSRIKSTNGQIIYTAEEYSKLWVCKQTVKRFIKLMKYDTHRVKIIQGYNVKIIDNGIGIM